MAKASRSTNKGFSLVELIIVIAIMAVLCAILVPRLVKYVERSREARDYAMILEIVEALNRVAIDPDVEISAGRGDMNSKAQIPNLGPTLTNKMAELYGEQGRMNTGGTGKGYDFGGFVSRLYQKNPPQLNYQYSGTGNTGYIVITWLNPILPQS